MEETAELNRQNDARMDEIAQDIRQNQPLTSDRQPLTALEEPYQDPGSQHFLAGVRILQQNYSHVRMVRGDGNCYYRAFLFSVVEQLLLAKNKQPKTTTSSSPPPQQSSEGQRILEWIKTDSWKQVLAMGYDEMTLEIFYDAMVDLLERVVQDQSFDLNAFTTEMNQENHTSDYCTWYMRVLTATHLKSDPGRFLPFLIEEHPGMDIQQFCQREVEPMGKECEMVQALALAEALGVTVQIEYLDGKQQQQDGQGGELTHHIVGKQTDPGKENLFLTLLYRPGHYDILYGLQ